MSLRVIFMGTSGFSIATLKAFLSSRHEVVAIYSQPPRPGGRRGLNLAASAVNLFADGIGFKTLTPARFDQLECQRFLSFNADVAIVVSYGLILPEIVLTGTKFGCYNGHASILPRWRGAAPIQRAIMAGDKETGIAIMKMDKKLDTGPVVLVKKIPIGIDTTSGMLKDSLGLLCAEAMLEVMTMLEENKLDFVSQKNEGVIYAPKISKDETRVDFSKSAYDVHNHIRGLSPSPGAWLEMLIGNKMCRIKVLASRLGKGKGSPGQVINYPLEVACGQGSLSLIRLQRAGGTPLEVNDFLRGISVDIGTIIG
ncbi:Methionyl-tRNA formyltransferase [Liberibacter crescens BT-1]|uniref:Methionyl-tRNA formyltransferase n=1 Tax=Liberibacter crescens (strain BT-1) TaxID=1215343 RepID=L0EXC8_LIBCB|nr:methionyl-tRNA formyltransferase [Liberibacter crescens]AGA65323.1 Methionyl-tRNA formyltransferase [Liberibacter crescens BT-1]AMC13252.1 methionyl-tRNA formyltransferase [Liberibacter crescens]